MPSPGESVERESVLRLITEVLRRRRIIAATVLVIAPVVLASGLMLREYEARARVVVQQELQAASPLMGLAAQVGLSVGAGGERTPAFFSELMRSREVLDTLAYTRIASTQDEPSEPPQMLVDILGIPNDLTRSERALRAVSDLRSRLATSSDLQSSILTVRLRLPRADLAEQTLDSLIAIVERANRARQRASFSAEREFAESRVAAALADLDTAQRMLADFLTENRSYVGSPTLQLQAANLQRVVDLRQSVLLSVAQAAEQAKLEEVRNTPILTIVESATGSAEHTLTGRFLLLLGVMLGLVLGFLMAMAAYLRDVLAMSNAGAYNEVRALVGRSIFDPLGIRPG